MTACAMTVGMVPMALALERGSQMQAPLGRAVIGGLVMSTFATLLVLPSIFALVIGRKQAVSPSIYPDDPESTHYDPLVFVNEAQDAHHGPTDGHARPTVMPRPTATSGSAGMVTHSNRNEDAVIFLRQILDEARAKRHDMVTHYTVDDLLVALGFAKAETDKEVRTGSGGTPGSRAPAGEPAGPGLRWPDGFRT